MTPANHEHDEVAEVKETMIELHVTLKRLIEDVKVVPSLKERVAALELVAKKVDELYDLIHIGGTQEPMAHRVRSNTKSLKWAREEIKKLKADSSARTIGPKERLAIYALISTAVGTAVKAYLSTH